MSKDCSGLPFSGSPPTISIVVPTFERRDTVCETVKTLATQVYADPFEIVVVVDGSGDGTAEALARLGLRVPLKIIEQPNRGAAAARNRGSEEATGRILLFLDDDMFCAPDLLEQHARSHAAGADGVLGLVRLESNSPDGFLTAGLEHWLQDSRSEEVLSPFDIFTGQLSIRRDLFQELGGFDTWFTEGGRFGNEDADFGARLLKRHTVAFNREAITYQRYVVGPRLNIKRAFQSGRADVEFIRRYPTCLPRLLELRNVDRAATKWIYRPLAHLPMLPKVLARFAAALAEGALKTRWKSNRFIARVFYASRSIAYWSAVHSSGGLPSAGRALVLGYHIVEGTANDPVLAPYGVDAEVFADHVARLERRGFNFVSPDDVISLAVAGCPLPEKSVLLTFDDCYAELLSVVRSVLSKRRIPSLAFAVTKLEYNAWDIAAGARRLTLLDDQGLRELQGSGCEIGSHTRTHRLLPKLDADSKQSEIAGSREDLHTRDIGDGRFLAYPYGAHDAESRSLAKAAGYRAAFAFGWSFVTPGAPVMELPRVEVRANDTGWRFWLKTTCPRLGARL